MSDTTKLVLLGLGVAGAAYLYYRSTRPVPMGIPDTQPTYSQVGTDGKVPQPTLPDSLGPMVIRIPASLTHLANDLFIRTDEASSVLARYGLDTDVSKYQVGYASQFRP